MGTPLAQCSATKETAEKQVQAARVRDPDTQLVDHIQYDLKTLALLLPYTLSRQRLNINLAFY